LGLDDVHVRRGDHQERGSGLIDVIGGSAMLVSVAPFA
jgi:hypothetical protein